MVSVRHEMTYTQYAYKDSINGGLVSYDDEQAICDKTEYALENELNGFIIWVSTTAWTTYSQMKVSHTSCELLNSKTNTGIIGRSYARSVYSST